MRHTKGPWKPCLADGDGCSCHMIWSEPADCVVAVAIGAKDENFTGGEGIVNEAMIRANARLIAASPDMYEALEELMAGLREDMGLAVGQLDGWIKAKQALAKAQLAKVLDKRLGEPKNGRKRAKRGRAGLTG